MKRLIAAIKRNYREIIVVFVCTALFFVSRSFLFWTPESVPLWYDPGLYKLMREAYVKLWSERELYMLPGWITKMHEPLLWMLWSLVAHSTGLHVNWISLDNWSLPDRIHTWWWLIVSAFLPMTMYMFGRRISPYIGYIALFLCIMSFTQRYIFWWWYRKQLIGIGLIFSVVSMRSRGERKHMYASALLIGATFIVNRPAGVLLAAIAGIYAIIAPSEMGTWSKDTGSGWWVDRRHPLLAIGAWCVLVFPILWPFIHIQILPLIDIFIHAIDTPNWDDNYQASGAFLTTWEYMYAWWRALLWGIAAIFISLSTHFKWLSSKVRPALWWLFILTGVLAVRVAAQLFFFQRMIGYLDACLILLTAYALEGIRVWGMSAARKYNKKWLIYTLGVLVISAMSFTLYDHIQPFRTPLLTQWELNVAKTLDTRLPDDAMIIVPSRRYSPRVAWRVRRDTIAPGLFDLQERTLPDRKRIWLDSPDEVKWNTVCNAILTTYGHLDRPLYIRMWHREPSFELQWYCLKSYFRDTTANVWIYAVEF